MERSIRPRLARAAAHLALVAGLSGPSASAQGPAPLPPGTPASTVDLMIALGRTRDQGIPTVVVATSTARPQSGGFLRALADSPWSRSTRGLVQVVELPVEQNPALAREFRLASAPAVMAYTPGPGGPVFRGQRPCENADEAVAWLVALGLPDGRTAPAPGGEAGIVRANYQGGYPSSQQPAPAPPPAPVPTLAPPTPAYAPPMTYAPALAYPQPAQAPASFVTLPGPNVVVQQGQPNVFVTQAAPVAAAPASNFFLPAAAPAPMATMQSPAAPAAAPVMAMPAMALMPQPASAAPAAVAPQPALAPASQTVSVPTNRTKTTVRVRGPGLINAALAHFGQKLVNKGRTTIETIQSTELSTPVAQNFGGVATLTTTNPAPVAAPPMAPPVQYAPPAQAPPVCEAPPPPPAPTPQASPQTQRRAPGKHNHN